MRDRAALDRPAGNGAAAALVVVVTVAAFLPALGNGFLVNWDDPANFLDNPHYRGLGPAQLRWMFTTFHMGHYIPLTWVSLGLDYLLWGMSPAGYHLTSLLLHAATALVFYFLARRLLALALSPSGEEGVDEGALRIGAAAAALLWAVHPLRVESVAWATERRDVLSGFFYVAAALAYVKAVAGAPRARWYWVSLGCFAAALASKAITTTLPVVLLVLDVYPLRRLGGAHGWRVRRVWLEKVPFFVLSAVAAVVAFKALFTLGNARSLADLGVPERLVLTVYGLAFYLFKSVAPLELSPLYPLDVHVSWFHFAAVLGGGLLAWLGRRRWPAFSAAAAIYATTLFPVSGIFHNGPQSVADRYSYLACLGWALLGGAAAARPWGGRRVARCVLAAWVAAMGFLTAEQTARWRDSITLWSHAVAVNPQSRAAHFNLAGAYEQAGRWAEALAAYREVLRLSPADRARWQVNVAWMYEKSGVPRGALEAYREALRLKPGLPDACAGLRRLAGAGSAVAPGDLGGCPPVPTPSPGEGRGRG